MRLYRALDRARLPGGYVGKFFVVAFLGTHLPLIAAILLLLREREADWTLLGTLLAATLAGTLLAFLGIRALLDPVRLSADALRRYGEAEALPDLPLGHRDLAGRLLGTTQETLAQLDGALTAARGARQEALDTARRRERALTEVTHELRTPLNAVLGFAELLQMQPHGPLGHERYTEFADDIATGGRHMLTLIEDVQRYAALREGREALDRRRIPLAPLAQRAARLLRAEAAERGMAIEVDVPEGLAVVADSRSVIQILLNLLGNALKYAGPGASASVVARAEGGMVSLRVADDGRGMDAAELALALEPFGRVGGTGERGTGLGLPLVRTLVELHDGRFVLESRRGKGTVARIGLPAAPGDARA